MGVAVNIGLGIGCLIIAVLMAVIGGWFSWSGLRDRDWSALMLAILILAVAVFAVISAVSLFTKV
jgi:drug/metabolite transporter superfamily protein YnfA